MQRAVRDDFTRFADDVAFSGQRLTLDELVVASDAAVRTEDLSADVLLELFGGAIVASLKLIQQGRLGVEEASAAAASVFLGGARAR